MRLADARTLTVGDRVLATFAGKTREGWITFIDPVPSNGKHVYQTFWIAVLGERQAWACYPRQIIRRVDRPATPTPPEAP